MAAKGITFEEWIDRKGPKALAKKLGVTHHTVLHWRSGRCDPRVHVMRKIKRLTRGEIGYDQMIDRSPATRNNRVWTVRP